jgi:hypothetical protein
VGRDFETGGLSDAEQALDRRLEQQLAESYLVYRNVAWLTKATSDEPRDGEADFVIAHPELGILVVEVKGGGIRRVGGRWESVGRNGTSHQIKDPFDQVRREMYSLKRIAEGRPEWPAHDVRFCRAVAFPDIRYETAFQPDGPPEIVIDADDLDHLEARIREIFDWWAAHPEEGRRGGAPGAIGMNALHSLLGRDFEIPSPLQLQLAEDEREIIRLSDQQFAILDALRAQRRALILGVAGSGKTLLAAEQTRRMAEAGHRVLLTCFNRPLAEYLRGSIGSLANVDVFTFHGLAEELATRAGVPLNKRHDDPTYFDIDLPQALADAVERLPEHRYDAIVVDEAQDIDAVWWLPLLDLLADRERGRLFVFGDVNQDLYHAEPDEIGVVMPDRPPVYLLEENRRTTRAIHDWAQQWATNRPLETDDAPLEFQPRSVGPAGRPVQVLTYPDGDADACRRVIASVLKELVGPSGGVNPRDIAVLSARSPRSSWLAGAKVGSWTLVSEAGPEGAPMPPPTSVWEIRLSTIHRFKGLESPVVILAEIDERVPEAQLPGLLYVGATRARTHLVVIGSEGTLP